MAQSAPVTLEAQAQTGSAEASEHMAQSTPVILDARCDYESIRLAICYRDGE